MKILMFATIAALGLGAAVANAQSLSHGAPPQPSNHYSVSQGSGG